ncbi:MAG: hypothetical protein ACT4PK_08220 [Gammaproteobacteria bacterium]
MTDTAVNDDERRRRNNIRLAWLHVALAMFFVAWFVWAQVHR